MNSSLLEKHRKTRTPPSPPTSKEDKGGGDNDDHRGHVLIYGENETKLQEILHIPRTMADSMWPNMFHLSDFTDIDELDDYLHGKVLGNPKLLVSLIYLVTQENVNRCLGSFLGFFEKVPGFSSSSDLQDTIRNIKGKLDDAKIGESPLRNLPEEFLESTILRGELKAHVVNVLSCEHAKKDTPLVLTAEMDPLLDRLPDIGDIIRRKFSGNIACSPPHETIVAQMTDFSMFGGQ